MLEDKYIGGFNLNFIPVFLSVYKHKSISKAATELCKKPSNVSHIINKLREHFNDPLFIKSGQGLSPTTYCTQLYQSISLNFDNMCSFLFQEYKEKDVIIYSPESVLIHFLQNNAHKLTKKIQALPQSISDQDGIEKLFALRQVDLAITLNPVDYLSVTSEKMTSIRLIILCRKNHPLNSKENVCLLELMKNESWVRISHEYPYSQFYRDKAIIDAAKSRKIEFESTSVPYNARYIANSDAIGFVSEIFFNSLTYEEKSKFDIIHTTQETFIELYLNYSSNERNINVKSITKKLHELFK